MLWRLAQTHPCSDLWDRSVHFLGDLVSCLCENKEEEERTHVNQDLGTQANTDVPGSVLQRLLTDLSLGAFHLGHHVREHIGFAVDDIAVR